MTPAKRVCGGVSATAWTKIVRGEKMADMLNDPIKTVMLIILIALEVPAAIALVVMWKKAKRDRGTEDG